MRKALGWVLALVATALGTELLLYPSQVISPLEGWLISKGLSDAAALGLECFTVGVCVFGSIRLLRRDPDQDQNEIEDEGESDVLDEEE